MSEARTTDSAAYELKKGDSSEQGEGVVDEFLSRITLAIAKSAETATQGAIPHYFNASHFSEIKKFRDQGNFLVKEYAPTVFRVLREKHFGISVSDFVAEWTLSHDKLIAKEGAGRSGALFCFSQNRKFIFKTIFHNEVETMLNFLQDYYLHMKEFPNTLLMRIVGLYRFSKIIGSVYVLVFNNLLYTDPQEVKIKSVYDLKGRANKTRRFTQPEEQQPSVMKDKDLTRKFYLGNYRQKFLQQLELDINLLANHNLMDYSLLIGIGEKQAKVSFSRKHSHKKKRKHHRRKHHRRHNSAGAISEADLIEAKSAKKHHTSDRTKTVRKSKRKHSSKKHTRSHHPKKLTKSLSEGNVMKPKHKHRSDQISPRGSEKDPEAASKSHEESHSPTPSPATSPTASPTASPSSSLTSRGRALSSETVSDPTNSTAPIDRKFSVPLALNMSIDSSMAANASATNLISPRSMNPHPPNAPFPGVKHHDLSLLTRKDEVNPEEKGEIAVDDEDEEATCQDSVFAKNAGGFLPIADTGEILYVGIIDMLTFYGTAKKIANTFKTVLWQPAELSTVEARYYATRFINYFGEILEELPPADREDTYNPYTAGTKEDNFLNEVVTGIRQSAMMTTTPVNLSTLDSSVYQAFSTLSYRTSLDGDTVVVMKGDKTFGLNLTTDVKSYAPLVFKGLRDLWGVTNEAYISSWNLPKALLTAKEGAGRSGALFCRSKDNRFLFKTIFRSEVNTLMECLQQYAEHMKKYPDSLLMRIMGLYRFSQPLKTSVYVLVFSNVMDSPVSVDFTYDLKGRKTKPGKVSRPVEAGSSVVYKDKDLHRVFHFGDMREPFLKQLELDTQFLEDSNLMDYSLLVGIHNITEKTEKLLNDPSSNPPGNHSQYQKHLGGFKGEEGRNELYFVGIIDMLTFYGTAKQIANTAKSFLWEKEELSTVEANFYRERFLNYHKEIIQ